MERFFGLLVVCLVSTGSYAQCDAGWDSLGNNCFKFYSSSVTYQEGRNYCESLRDGADLAILNDANTFRSVYEYIQQYDISGSFWLGGSDETTEGSWFWVDGSRIDLGTPFWALETSLIGYDQEPLGKSDENCLLIDESRHYYFDDRSCFNSNNALCMY